MHILPCRLPIMRPIRNMCMDFTILHARSFVFFVMSVHPNRLSAYIFHSHTHSHKAHENPARRWPFSHKHFQAGCAIDILCSTHAPDTHGGIRRTAHMAYREGYTMYTKRNARRIDAAKSTAPKRAPNTRCLYCIQKRVCCVRVRALRIVSRRVSVERRRQRRPASSRGLWHIIANSLARRAVCMHRVFGFGNRGDQIHMSTSEDGNATPSGACAV